MARVGANAWPAMAAPLRLKELPAVNGTGGERNRDSVFPGAGKDILGRGRNVAVEALVCGVPLKSTPEHQPVAGLALKAGARSVMASLWAVSDVSTSRLVGLFFENLQSSGLNKAQALQRAQQQLLAESE